MKFTLVLVLIAATAVLAQEHYSADGTFIAGPEAEHLASGRQGRFFGGRYGGGFGGGYGGGFGGGYVGGFGGGYGFRRGGYGFGFGR